MVEPETIEIPDFRIGERELTPGVAPIEGGTRIRIKGENFSDESTVTVAGSSATDVKMAESGRLLYVILPPGTEGIADVVIMTPGHPPRTISPGIRYVSDVVETSRGVMSSFNVHLTELRDRVQNMEALGTLDENSRIEMHLELEFAHRLSYEAIEQRSAAGGGPANSPAVVDVLASNEAVQRTLLADVFTYLAISRYE